MKTLCYSYVKYRPRVPWLLLRVEKIERENFDFVLLLLSFFLLLLLSSFFFLFSFPGMTQKVYIRRTRMICTPNKCSTIRDLPFLGQSYMRAKIDKLWPKTSITIVFLYAIFVHNYTHNSITKGGIRTFYLSNDCSNIRDIYSLGYSYMQDAIGKISIQTQKVITLRYTILCLLIHS